MSARGEIPNLTRTTARGEDCRTPARAKCRPLRCDGVGGGSRAIPKGGNRGRADADSSGVVLWGFEQEEVLMEVMTVAPVGRARTLVAFARCRMSSFGKAVPIADLDCIVRG
jgi:hypothetical protein